MSVETEFNLLIDPTWADISQIPPKVPMMTNEAYVAAVREDITGIMKNPVGAVVLDRLKRWNRVVRVTPVRGYSGACSSPSAYYLENRDMIWNRTISPLLNNIGLHTRPVWSVVFYTPGAFDPGGVCILDYKKDPRSNYVPSRQEVFVHELVHAIRMMSRTYDTNSISVFRSNLQDFDSIEEFVAILVQNMFQSAGKGKLRSNHHGFRELDPDLASSFEFFKISTKSYAAVEKFVRSNKFFTANLGKLDVAFNPIKAILTDPKKCLEFSKSEDAQIRDAGPLMAILKALTPGVSLQMWQKLLPQ